MKFFTFLFLTFSILSLRPKPVGMTSTNGDEPHYLVMSNAIIQKRTQELPTLYKEKTYLPWYENQSLPAHLIQGVYPLHQWGFPAILSTPLRLLGPKGVGLFLAFITALTLTILHNLATRYFDPKTSLYATLFLAFSIPISINSSAIYPELICMFLLSIILERLLTWKNNLNYYLPTFFSVLLLPWLHIKFSALLSLLLVFLIEPILNKKITISIKKHFLPFFVFTLTGVVSILSYLFFLRNQYGTISLAIQSFTVGRGLDFHFTPYGFLGLLTDGSIGLFIYNPIFFLVFVVAISTLINKKQNLRLRFSIILGLLYLALIGSYPDILNGFQLPNRNLLPLIPLFFIPLCQLIQKVTKSKRYILKYVFLIFLSTSLLISLILIIYPNLGFSYGEGNAIVNTFLPRQAKVINQLLPKLNTIIAPTGPVELVKSIVLLLLFLVFGTTLFL